MKQRRSFFAAAVLAAIAFASQSLVAEVQEKSAKIAGTTLHYKVVLPNGYDAEKTYPAVLAFPGGGQTMQIVDSSISRNWRSQAERRGYIVVIPAAPDGELFFEGGDRVFPEFLKRLLSEYKVQDGKFHIAGNSNGGISAFHIAAEYPQYFLSVTGFPGYLPDEKLAGSLKNMCINMHVGELDPDWLQTMKTQAGEFRTRGFKVRFTVEKDQHHLLGTLAGDGATRLFDQFDEARNGCPGGK